jgi:hypothetical protein
MKPCSICISPNRSEIEELRLQKKLVLRDIIQIMSNKYQEKLSYASLSRHFNNCIDVYIDAAVKSSKLRDVIIKQKLREELNATMQLQGTIKMLNEQFVAIRNTMNTEEGRKEAREIARILDTVLNTALQYSERLKQDNADTVTNDDVYDRLLWSLQESNIPVEYIKVIKDKWVEYGKQNNPQ